MSYLDCSIAEIHQAYLEGKTTPLELTKEALLRAKVNLDNCFEVIDEAGALAFAESLTYPEEDNLLWGIPYAAKDNFSTKGIETTASSNMLNGYVPVFDATVIAKLKEKKAILIGKTTMDELAMGGTGMTGHKGWTYNPFDPSHKRMIGGSSCGSAAAVAAGIVPFSLGSDTGDSIRKPASYGGLVGLKPTWGRISRFGLFPFAPSLDHVGFFTRNVEDCAILLSALAGRDEKDATSSEKPVEDYCHYPLQKEGVRIGVIAEIIDAIQDEDVKGEFRKTLAKLEEYGAKVDFVHMNKDLLVSIYATYFVISSAEATSNNAYLDGIKFGPYYEGDSYIEVMTKARSNGFSERIKRRFMIGSFVLLSENQEELFLKAQRNRAKIVDELNKLLRDYDFLISPASPTIAKPFAPSLENPSDDSLLADNYLAMDNFAGLPSITLPFAFKDGMPLGINLSGRPFEEGKLLAYCREIEDVTGLRGLSILNKEEKL